MNEDLTAAALRREAEIVERWLERHVGHGQPRIEVRQRELGHTAICECGEVLDVRIETSLTGMTITAQERAAGIPRAW